jgi:hypothetical protein
MVVLQLILVLQAITAVSDAYSLAPSCQQGDWPNVLPAATAEASAMLQDGSENIQNAEYYMREQHDQDTLQWMFNTGTDTLGAANRGTIEGNYVFDQSPPGLLYD